MEIGAGGAAAKPPSGIELDVGNPFGLRRVVVGVGGKAGFAAGLLEGAGYGIIETS